jgi:hypothetical protein
MLLKITEEVHDNASSFNLNFVSPKTKNLDEFVKYLLTELKKSATADGKVYVHRKTWADKLGIHPRTLSRYINKLIDSNHLIKIPNTDERYDQKKGKLSYCLQIVQDPLKYTDLLIEHLKKSVEEFNLKIKKD